MVNKRLGLLYVLLLVSMPFFLHMQSIDLPCHFLFLPWVCAGQGDFPLNAIRSNTAMDRLTIVQRCIWLSSLSSQLMPRIFRATAGRVKVCPPARAISPFLFWRMTQSIALPRHNLHSTFVMQSFFNQSPPPL